MSRLWKRIVCMSLVLTMLVPGNAVFAAEMPAEIPVEDVSEQEETVLDENATEEVVPEAGIEEAVPEEGTEEVVPEESTEEAVPEEGTEEVVPEEGTEETVLEESTEEAVPEAGATEVVLKETIKYEAEMEATTGTWTSDENGWKFLKADGSYAEEEVLEISGKFYGFNGDGYMYADEEFWDSGYDEETDTWNSGYYRAKEDGSLYVNEWYVTDWSSYYYGEGGLAYSGIHSVGDQTYYFYSDGQMATNTFVETDDDKEYIIDSNGVLTLVTGTQWHHVEDEWYYSVNGELLRDGAFEVNGKFYGFNYYGRMYDNQEFSIDFYDENGNYQGYHCYRAKEGGALYVNEWYEAYWGDKYYYGEDAIAYSGIQTIDGEERYFSKDGLMAVNKVVNADGVNYIADQDGNLTEVSGEGWVTVSEDTYYVQDGEILQNGIYTIENQLYAFDYEGRMYDNTSFGFSTYDDNDVYLGYYYYRAKEGGALYVNEWYETSWEGKYYYGEDGAGYQGFQTVGSTEYYFFEDGKAAINTTVTIDGVTYIADENGSLRELSGEDGWIQNNGSYYYIQNGELLLDGVYKIGNAYYGFESDGRMFADEEFYTRGYGENDTWGYHRAKVDGSLYTNQWYQDEYDNWYYYGAYGLAADGFLTVSGQNYYFHGDGRMAENEVITLDGTAYIIDANGYAVAVTKDGWHLASGRYYYRQNGTFLTEGVYKIGGVLYGFDYQGCMYDNTSFGVSTYDENDVYLGYYYYRAKAGGALYVNQWYQDEYDNWYYYGANGLAPSGFTKVNGVNYYFYGDGQMAANTTITDDGVDYLVNGDGVAVKADRDGWYQSSGEWFYRQNGEFLEDGIYEIGGKFYGFDWNGRMYADDTFYINGSYYHASSSGTLYVNQWYQSPWGGWYYYGVGGKAASGLQTIAGVQYYFYSDGEMRKGGIFTVEGKIYSCDANGVVKMLPDGWSQQDPWGGAEVVWYYTNAGSVVNGVVNTGSGYYVFDNSCMQEPYGEGLIEAWDSESDTYKFYLSPDGSGKIVTKAGWYACEENYYFVNSDYSLYTGLLKTGGKTYYCRPEMVYGEAITVGTASYMAGSTGELTPITKDGFYHTGDGSFYVSGGKVLTNAWKQIDGCWYYFSADGYAYSNTVAEIDGVDYIFREDGVMAANAFVTRDGKTYYANASGAVVTGEQQIYGKWYYFNEYGLRESALLESANGISVYAENGEYLGTVSGNGWKYLNGKYYYVSNGVLAHSEKKTIGGAEYIFNWAGWMYENKIVDWDDGYYYCAQGGAVVKGDWCLFNGSYYYADATGKLYSNGEYTIGGVKYYFDADGRMADKDFVYNGTLYKVASSGAIKSKAAATTVNLTDGRVVYYQQGKPYTGWKGSKYYRSGRIMANTISYCGDAYYAFDKNGNYLKNTWHNFEDSYGWVYAKADGKVAYDESLKIGSYTYGFDGFTMVTDAVYQGKYYDKNGHYVSTLSGNGWKQAGGEWYYLVNGAPVKYRLMDIAGKTYGFAYDGRMMAGYMGYVAGKIYYFDGNGILQKYTGWQQLYGNWFYFAEDYSCFEGWLKDSGKQYYFDYNGMVTGVQLIDGVLYNFGTDGVLKSGYKAKDGWLETNEGWCYVMNGKPLSGGLYKLGGSWYYFDYRGVMAENEPTGYGFATSSGALITSRGWHKLSNGKWIYIGSGNNVYTEGAYYIGGTLYVFDYNGYWV